MKNAIADALRKDLFEGKRDKKLTETLDTLSVTTDSEKNNLIIMLMYEKIKGDM